MDPKERRNMTERASERPLVGRRGFLGAITATGGCAMATMLLPGCEVAELKATGETLTSFDFDVNDSKLSALATVGGIAPVDAGVDKLILIRLAADQVSALDRICTHAACEIAPPIGTWDQASKTLTCLCHNSKFGGDGKFKTGPEASADLASYLVTFDATTGKGTIDLGSAA
jgi:Rieske Fe-S protein